jgi:hypothetical protein
LPVLQFAELSNALRLGQLADLRPLCLYQRLQIVVAAKQRAVGM